MKYSEEAKESIDNFSIDQSDYLECVGLESIVAQGNGSIYVRSLDLKAEVTIHFGNSSGCKVFIGNNVRGKIQVTFKGNNSTLYIGNDCRLKNLEIRSFQTNDFIAVGNHVTTASKNVWISGNGVGKANPAIIVGDDCMFSYDIVLRNSDAHPIYRLDTEEQINDPVESIHIEPHVWIGEQVTILKSVRVGACSIIALGSIVTKNIPRFSIAKGSPAVASVNPNIYWSRNANEGARKRAKQFVERYKNT